MAQRQAPQVNSISTFIDRIHQARPAQVVKIHETMVLDGESKYHHVNISTKTHPRVEILHLTDLQYGHKSFQEKRFVEFRDWVLSNPNRFVVFGGDLIDAATAISVQSCYENNRAPDEQVMHLVEDLLMPLQARVLGYVGGNHERRTAKTWGDAGRVIATLLGIPYSRGVQHVDIHYGRHAPFKLSLWHGGGSARTKGAKAQMLHRFMHQADSQVYLVGHLHDVVVLFDWRQRRKPNGKIELVKIAGAMSSSFLEYWGTFAEVSGMSATDTMMARIVLEPDGGWELTLR